MKIFNKFLIMRKAFISLLLILGINYSFSQSPGNCLLFDGTDDYVSVSDHSSLNFGTGSFSIEFWMKTNSTTITTVLNKKASSSADGWFLILNNGKVGFKINTSTTQYFGNIGDLNDGIWHHIALSCYATADEFDDLWEVTAYFDGSSIGSIYYLRTSVSNTETLYIGRNYSGSYFNGYLEEVRLWNATRSQTQIQTNMYTQISGSASGLKANWRFNESSGTSASDETSSNTGTLVNMSSGSWVASTVPMPFQTNSGAGNWSSASSWKSGIIPNNAYVPVQIDHNITVDNDYIIGKLTNNATITINATGSLKLNDQLVNSGTIKVLSNSAGDIGSFIDYGTGTFGTNIVSKYITDNKWHYISSPITAANVSIFNGGSVWAYDESTATWSRLISGNLTTTKGYDIYYANTGAKTVDISGTFNTGSQSISLTYNSSGGIGYNLVGNPYPSTIDWDAASGWSRTNVNGAVYIWNPNTPGVETYVLEGGTGTNGGSRYIPATQGFFVICSSNTTLGMNNNVRVTTNRELRNEYNSNELRIKVSGFDYSDESLIRFNNLANSIFDGMYDAYKFYSFNKSMPQIYTLDSKQTEYAINSIKPVSDNTIVPLNLYVGVEGEYTLEFDRSHLDENCDIILQDLFTGEFFDVNSGEKYKFISHFNDDQNRFLLHFNKAKQIFNDIDYKINESANVYSYQNNIYIYQENTQTEQSEVMIYNLSGKKVFSEKKVIKGLELIKTDLPQGIYFVKIQTGNEILTKKISIL